MMAAVGTCSGAATEYPSITINEVTTVATVWALQQFMTDAVTIGTSPTNLTGLSNAFLQVPNLVNIPTGVALTQTPAGNGTTPKRVINTLANILASCINSSGSTSPQCSGLFSQATPFAQTPATDTVKAAWYIAKTPAANLAPAGIMALAGPTPPFQPNLGSTPPNDWTLSVGYTGGGMTTPYGLDIDAGGNIWVANSNVNSVTSAFDISRFSAVGVSLAGPNGFGGNWIQAPIGVAIDFNGNCWVANGSSSNGTLYVLAEIDTAGADVTGVGGYTSPGLGAAGGLAVDPGGAVYVTTDNSNAIVTRFGPGATSGTDTTIGYGGLSLPQQPVLDAGNNLWVPNGNTFNGAYDVSQFVGSSLTDETGGSGWTNVGLNLPNGLAIDHAGNAWISNSNGSLMTVLDNVGHDATGQNGYVVANSSQLREVAVDGVGNIWVADAGNNVVFELNSAGTVISTPNGYKADNVNFVAGMAIDSSGNLWLTSFSAGELIQFVGLAAPVSTPLVTQALGNAFGTRP